MCGVDGVGHVAGELRQQTGAAQLQDADPDVGEGEVERIGIGGKSAVQQDVRDGVPVRPGRTAGLHHLVVERDDQGPVHRGEPDQCG
jgi:hypothetical protein